MFSITPSFIGEVNLYLLQIYQLFLRKEEIRDNRVLVTVFLRRRGWKKTYESVKSGFLGFSCAVTTISNDQKMFSN